MEPTDQPPSAPAEAALQQAAPASPPRAASGPLRVASGPRMLVLAAVATELVAIGAGCNQWVTEKVAHYTGSPLRSGFLHQFVFSTQTFAWRVSSTAGQSSSQPISSLVRVAVTVTLSAALIALIVRRGSFWRAGFAALLAVVFAGQVAEVIARLVYAGPTSVGFTGYSAANQLSPAGLVAPDASAGGGRASLALFGSATGYRFVGSALLAVLVAVVVGVLARRSGSDTPSEAVAARSGFFAPGEFQRTYEAAAVPAVYVPPQAPLGARQERGRHARPDD